MGEPVSFGAVLMQRLNRLKRAIKRRWRYVVNLFSNIRAVESQTLREKSKCHTVGTLRPGDLVRIRSREEIQQTLNNWGQLKGCSFMEEMRHHCGTTQRVFKRVEQFLDERDYLIKKCHGIVLLEGVICGGTKDFGTCDRSCYYFWREEWLERIG